MNISELINKGIGKKTFLWIIENFNDQFVYLIKIQDFIIILKIFISSLKEVCMKKRVKEIWWARVPRTEKWMNFACQQHQKPLKVCYRSSLNEERLRKTKRSQRLRKRAFVCFWNMHRLDPDSTRKSMWHHCDPCSLIIKQ